MKSERKETCGTTVATMLQLLTAIQSNCSLCSNVTYAYLRVFYVNIKIEPHRYRNSCDIVVYACRSLELLDENNTASEPPDSLQQFTDMRVKCYNNLAAAQLKVFAATHSCPCICVVVLILNFIASCSCFGPVF